MDFFNLFNKPPLEWGLAPDAAAQELAEKITAERPKYKKFMDSYVELSKTENKLLSMAAMGDIRTVKIEKAKSEYKRALSTFIYIWLSKSFTTNRRNTPRDWIYDVIMNIIRSRFDFIDWVEDYFDESVT